MATAMVNGVASTSEPNAPVNAMPTTGKQQSKSSFSNKAAESNRKQAANASDATQRRAAPQKAWQSGMNPLTQRSTTPAQQNGVGPHNKHGSQKPYASQETISTDRYAHERLLCLLGNSMGGRATLTVKNGDVFTGIFVGAIMENQESTYMLKMVQQTKASVRGEPNGVQDSSAGFVGKGEDFAISFDTKEVVDLAVEGIVIDAQHKMQNGGFFFVAEPYTDSQAELLCKGSSTGFRTDTDISGNTAMPERDLQRWEPSNITDANLLLESSGGSWDQFQVNEQRFGLKSDYDENIYTTRIDRSRPDYRQREAEARRIAQEIEGSSTNNLHTREERGMVNEDDGIDEEEKYSGVARHSQDFPALQSGQSNRYMPPARRFPTAKATIPGAPVDPAIITSQVARRDNVSVTESTPAEAQNQEDVSSTGVKPEPPGESTAESSKVDVETPPSTSRPSGSSKGPIPSDSATANVEANLLDSFRTFANMEKMRVSDHRRQRVSQDKAIKLNDLMKFSKNFNLKTPVPKDLVPILAKDKSKQEEIMEKAQRNAQQFSNPSPSSTSATSEQKTLKTVPEGPRESKQALSNVADRQDYSHVRQGYPLQSQQPTLSMRDRQLPTQNIPLASDKPAQGYLGHRLHESHGQHKAGMRVAVPPPIPIHGNPKSSTRPTVGPTSTSQTPSSVRTPTSAISSKFNVKAPDFKPNPAASAFRPSGGPSAISSPVSTPGARPTSRAQTPTAFFRDRKPLPASERLSINDYFNPLKRLRENAVNEGKAKDYSSNGGIKYAYTTTPAWKMAKDENVMKSYASMFEGDGLGSGKISPQPAHQVNSAVPHQHQLPPHLQQNHSGTPQLQAPHPAPFPVQPQAHHYPSGQHHYDDHRMHLSASNAGSYHPSPRMQNNSMTFPSPMQQPAQLAYGQPAPQYVMGPNGPQAAHFRQFPGAPQMMPTQGTQLAAPMMVQQSSQNGFMAPAHGMALPFNPQMPMYPPGQTSYNGQSQPPSGFPSPGRGASMMLHQGSHQGQQPMYMNPNQYGQPLFAQQQPPHMMPMRAYGSPQPHYAQSPQPPYNFPPQPHRVPSNSYTQPPQGPHHHQNQHQHMQHPPPSVPMENGEEMK